MRNRILIILTCVFVSAFIFFMVGKNATAPANRVIGSPPSDLPIETVSFADKYGKDIKAWAISGNANRGIVLLLHGIRSDRRSMMRRARFLFRDGYSILMIDLQAHGESPGDKITFGYLEAHSVTAAIKFARVKWPKKRLGIIGSSVGGAAAIFAARQKKAGAYILEAVYSSLRDATENRLKIRFGEIGPFFAPLLLWQTPIQLGFHFDELSTVDNIKQINAPLLIIAGEKDQRTTLNNSKALYANAGKPKSIWIVPAAGHQDFHRFLQSEYERRVLDFFGKYINQNHPTE